MVYKEFDLEAAREGEPLITRDGKNAMMIYSDLKDTQHIVCVVDISGVEQTVVQYYSNGRAYACGNTSGYDLFMRPIKKVGFVNVFSSEDKDFVTDGVVYDSYAKCHNEGVDDKNYICTTKIEFEV